MARRLVERGVPYITINYGGWDTHKDNFQAMQQKLPELDKGLATLLQDLSDRGLLDSTVIWCCGEFGRTPKIEWEPPWNGGRSHYGKVFSAAGRRRRIPGRPRRGRLRRQGRRGQGAARLPLRPARQHLRVDGIDPEGRLPTRRAWTVTSHPSAADGIPMAGRLKEIM